MAEGADTQLTLGAQLPGKDANGEKFCGCGVIPHNSYFKESAAEEMLPYG